MKKAIQEYFDGKSVSANDKLYTISAYMSGMITVDGISRVGVTSQNDADEMTAIGFEFYKLLKDAPDFRYGMTGVEIDGFADFDELIEDPEFYLKFKGFVITKELYHAIKGKTVMQPFMKGYLWIPYEGEAFRERQ